MKRMLPALTLALLVLSTPALAGDWKGYNIRDFGPNSNCPFFTDAKGTLVARCAVRKANDAAPAIGTVELLDVGTATVKESYALGKLPAKRGDKEFRANLDTVNELLKKKKLQRREVAEIPLTKATEFKGRRIITTYRNQTFVGSTARLNLASKECCKWNSLTGFVFLDEGFILGTVGSECKVSDKSDDPCFCNQGEPKDDAEKAAWKECFNPSFDNLILRAQKKK